jgi:hypothetical protein
MKTGARKSAIRAAIVAFNPNSYVPHDQPEMEELLVDTVTPEEILERKEKEETRNNAFESMSDEAKQIIDIIINSPQELASVFLTPSGRMAKGDVCRNRLFLTLARQWKDRRYARKTIEEIQIFVGTFD